MFSPGPWEVWGAPQAWRSGEHGKLRLGTSRNLITGNLRRYCRDLALTQKTAGRDGEGREVKSFWRTLGMSGLPGAVPGLLWPSTGLRILRSLESPHGRTCPRRRAGEVCVCLRRVPQLLSMAQPAKRTTQPVERQRGPPSLTESPHAVNFSTCESQEE